MRPYSSECLFFPGTEHLQGSVVSWDQQSGTRPAMATRIHAYVVVPISNRLFSGGMEQAWSQGSMLCQGLSLRHCPVV